MDHLCAGSKPHALYQTQRLLYLQLIHFARTLINTQVDLFYDEITNVRVLIPYKSQL